jgi:flavin-binding protein dodecin
MSVARVTEITSTSTVSFQDAVDKGIARVLKTMKDVEGILVQDQKVLIADGSVSGYRVNMKVTFLMNE